MSVLDVVVGSAGFAITVMVIAAMVLLTPGGTVDVHDGETDPMGSELSSADRAAR